MIKCSQCESTDWHCWDERTEFFEDHNLEIFEFPVGYLKCNNCGHSWADYGPECEGLNWIGDYRELMAYLGLDYD